MLFIFIGCVWATTFFVPETFAVVFVVAVLFPVSRSLIVLNSLLRRRAQRLRKQTGNPAYMSMGEVAEADITFSSKMSTALIRPFGS